MSVGVWRFEERVPDARPRFREPAGQRSGYVAVVDAAGRSLRSRPFGRCFARLVIHTFVRPPPQGRSAPRFRLLRSGAPAPRSFNSLSPCSSNLSAMRRSGLVVRCGVDRVTDKYRANRRFFQIPCLFFALRRPVYVFLPGIVSSARFVGNLHVARALPEVEIGLTLRERWFSGRSSIRRGIRHLRWLR